MQSLFLNMYVLCLLHMAELWMRMGFPSSRWHPSWWDDSLWASIAAHKWQKMPSVLHGHIALHQIPHKTSRKPQIINSMKLTVCQTFHEHFTAYIQTVNEYQLELYLEKQNARGRFIFDVSNTFAYPFPPLRTFAVHCPGLGSALVHLHPICLPLASNKLWKKSENAREVLTVLCSWKRSGNRAVCVIFFLHPGKNKRMRVGLETYLLCRSQRDVCESPCSAEPLPGCTKKEAETAVAAAAPS